MSHDRGHRGNDEAAWLSWLGISLRRKRGIRRPTEDAALANIRREERRVAQAARQGAWAQNKRRRRRRMA